MRVAGKRDRSAEHAKAREWRTEHLEESREKGRQYYRAKHPCKEVETLSEYDARKEQRAAERKEVLDQSPAGLTDEQLGRLNVELRGQINRSDLPEKRKCCLREWVRRNLYRKRVANLCAALAASPEAKVREAERSRAYRAAHKSPDRDNQRSTDWYWSHLEEARARHRASYQRRKNNPKLQAYIRFKNQERLAAKKGVEFKLTPEEYGEIMQYPCVVCGSTNHLELGHILAVSKGGKTEKGNLVSMCRRCNRKLHDRYLWDVIEDLRHERFGWVWKAIA